MAAKPIGERVTALETIVPEIKEDMSEVKESMKSLHAKMDRFIENVNKDLEGKASKKSVEGLEGRLRNHELKQAGWASIGSLLGWVAGWFGKGWFTGGSN